MYCNIKKKMYYIHCLYGKSWFWPAAFSPKETEGDSDDDDIPEGKKDHRGRDENIIMVPYKTYQNWIIVFLARCR